MNFEPHINARLTEIISKLSDKDDRDFILELLRSNIHSDGESSTTRHSSKRSGTGLSDYRTVGEESSIWNRNEWHSVATELRAGRPVLPEYFEDCSIFFSDVVGFTNIASSVPPIDVFGMLNQLYTVMDYCVSLFPLYKVETIGDAYMVAGGLPKPDKDHALHIANFALMVQLMVGEVKSPLDGEPLRIRIGIHSGPVLGGIVGNTMPRYCLFGNTVNVASRMESTGEAGMIQCSADAEIKLRDSEQFELSPRGEIEVKGKGVLSTFWLNGPTGVNTIVNADAIDKQCEKARRMLGRGRRERPGSDIAIGDISMTMDEIASELYSADAGHSCEMPASLRVMVVEDSAAQRKIFIRQLKAVCARWEIIAAESTDEAVNRARAVRCRIDLAFIDYNLCGTDCLSGCDLMEFLRTNLMMIDCIFIGCSTNPEKCRDEFMQAGADDVWGKPPPKPDEIRANLKLYWNSRIGELPSEQLLEDEWSVCAKGYDDEGEA